MKQPVYFVKHSFYSSNCENFLYLFYAWSFARHITVAERKLRGHGLMKLP